MSVVAILNELGHLHNTPTQPITFLGRIGVDPSRLLTVPDWWDQMDEPVELLSNPEATFRPYERVMINLCETNGIIYRPPPRHKGQASQSGCSRSSTRPLKPDGLLSRPLSLSSLVATMPR